MVLSCDSSLADSNSMISPGERMQGLDERKRIALAQEVGSTNFAMRGSRR